MAQPKLLVLSLLLCVPALSAANVFASPQGTPQGDGTIANPWDLQTALNQTSAIQPGDTLWLLGGTYLYSIALTGNNNGFSSNLNGTAAAPIVVRNYQAEHVTIDGHGMYAALAVYGSYVWYWGLEIMDSAPVRITQQSFDFGVGSYGPGNRFINLVVHDTSQGFSAFLASPDTEVYGNLVYYNGFINPQGADRVNFGHGMYFQNLTGRKTVGDNIIFDNAAYGMQLYGSVNSSLVGFLINGNVSFNNSSWAGLTYGFNYIIANADERKNIQFTNNYSYFPLDAQAGQNALGLYTLGQDILVTGSVFAGGYNPLEMQDQVGPVTFTGNFLYATQGLGLVNLDLGSAPNLSQYTWNNNSYYGDNAFLFPGGTGTFSQWQAATGFDSASTFSANPPIANLVFVRPNQYEPKRANIVVYNWTGANDVAVDLSKVFAAGDQYVIQDAQNFYGAPVAQGTYTGGTVDVPLTSTVKSPLRGYATPPHTDIGFQTFVALLASAAPLPPVQVVMNPQAATVAQGETQSLTAVVVGSLDPTVTWSLSPSVGTISAAGVYTGPAAVSKTLNVTITATSVADTSASASAVITLDPPPVSVSGTSLVTPQTLGTLRNNYAGWAGMHITVASAELQVAGIGRWCVAGNTQVHALKIVDASTGDDVPRSLTSVFMGGCTPGKFYYGRIPVSVTLSPGRSYYVVSQENWNGDQWYDFNTTVATSGEASVVEAIYGNWTAVGSAGNSYVPVDIKFSVGSGSIIHRPIKPR
jgi:hypothetical protein